MRRGGLSEFRKARVTRRSSGVGCPPATSRAMKPNEARRTAIANRGVSVGPPQFDPGSWEKTRIAASETQALDIRQVPQLPGSCCGRRQIGHRGLQAVSGSAEWARADWDRTQTQLPSRFAKTSIQMTSTLVCSPFAVPFSMSLP